MMNSTLSPTNQRAIASLASLYALRMLGLFMVLPVMSLSGQQLIGATPQLLGLAMGVYGLSQAFLQIPAGSLSDRIGRKPVIIGGLLIFALGSIIAANSDTIYGVIIGRALQGCGAIASAIMALVTDLTDEEHRMKAMASIGASIGLSFSVALVLGPFLAQLGGLSAIFTVTAVLAIAGIFTTIWLIPNPPKKTHRDASALLPEVLRQLTNKQFWPLNIGIFLLHAVMVAIFVAVPRQLIANGLSADDHSTLYLPVLLVAFVLMVPMIIVAEKRRQMKSIVIIGAVIITIALFAMSVATSLWQWALLLLLYFWGFNLMEASLPSWLSKIAPAGAKGSAMGIYSTMQFLGAFAGGSLGGWLLANKGYSLLFVVLGALVLLWVFYILLTPAPQYLTGVRLPVAMNAAPSNDRSMLTNLALVEGVADVFYSEDEHAVYLKVKADAFQREEALKIIESKGENNGPQC